MFGWHTSTLWMDENMRFKRLDLNLLAALRGVDGRAQPHGGGRSIN
ncbi:hypothetical protein IE4872_PC00207 (plasmid) [Rhizobium gallicum]|uniref:Uncharacterized protein n=1 Tax=Rhizobium gallicum TaxID=56730 RepID=A0A1L5NQQ5_9HYPH|nr:hypothetical protein IE4872_PC00207 [Rhizobium gallicum]